MRFSLTIVSCLAAFAMANPVAIRQTTAGEDLKAFEPITIQFANLRFFMDPNFGGAEINVSGSSE